VQAQKLAILGRERLFISFARLCFRVAERDPFFVHWACNTLRGSCLAMFCGGLGLVARGRIRICAALARVIAQSSHRGCVEIARRAFSTFFSAAASEIRILLVVASSTGKTCPPVGVAGWGVKFSSFFFFSPQNGFFFFFSRGCLILRCNSAYRGSVHLRMAQAGRGKVACFSETFGIFGQRPCACGVYGSALNNCARKLLSRLTSGQSYWLFSVGPSSRSVRAGTMVAISVRSAFVVHARECWGLMFAIN